MIRLIKAPPPHHWPGVPKVHIERYVTVRAVEVLPLIEMLQVGEVNTPARLTLNCPLLLLLFSDLHYSPTLLLRRVSNPEKRGPDTAFLTA